MSDLSVTPSEVRKGTGPSVAIGSGLANVDITQGQVVYEDTTVANPMKLADATTQASADAKGISVNSAAAGQLIFFQKSGPVTIGAASPIVDGQVYVVSATAGGIALESDIMANESMFVLGVGSGKNIILNLGPTAVVHA